MYVLRSSVADGETKTRRDDQPPGSSDEQALQPLFSALSAARKVKTHHDYYCWLQDTIRPYLPHDVLLFAWGNFQTGEIKFDITSAVTAVNTRRAFMAPGLVDQLCRLYTNERFRKSSWYIRSRNVESPVLDSLESELGLNEVGLGKVKSTLVCSLDDERKAESCLYVFFNLKGEIVIDDDSLALLLPHIEAANRRVKCWEPEEGHCPESRISIEKCLSERELEIMAWVSEGKSNSEIGTILGISHNTVKNHLKRVFSKMDVSARSQAVRVFLQQKAQEV